MSRIVLLAIGLSLAASVSPALADATNQDPNAKTPVIVRMGEVLTTRMGAEMVKEQAAAAEAADAKITKK